MEEKENNFKNVFNVLYKIVFNRTKNHYTDTKMFFIRKCCTKSNERSNRTNFMQQPCLTNCLGIINQNFGVIVAINSPNKILQMKEVNKL